MRKLIKSFYADRSVEEIIFSLVLIAGIPYFTINEIIDLSTNRNLIVLAINSFLLMCIIYLLYLSREGKLKKVHIFLFSLILGLGFALFWPASTGLSGPGAYVLQSLMVVLLLVNSGKSRGFFAIFLIVMILVAGYANINYSGKIVYLNQVISFMLNSIVIALVMNLFKKSLEKERRRLILRINEQEIANSELKMHNETLKKNQEEIVQIQTRLQEIIDERALEIEKENERMVKYAFINAHLVRAPLANILGLCELKSSENPDYELLHQKIEDLDKVVRKIGGVLSISRE